MNKIMRTMPQKHTRLSHYVKKYAVNINCQLILLLNNLNIIYSVESTHLDMLFLQSVCICPLILLIIVCTVLPRILFQ